MKRWISLGLLLALLPAPTLAAVPAITCHCFRDFAYNPSDPQAADSYFLATFQNRLMSAVFERSRREVVLAKQKGAGNDDLWIAYRAAAVTGVEPQTLLAAKAKAEAWQPVFVERRIDLALGPWAEAGDLARRIVAATLAEEGLAGAPVTTELFARGAGTQEAILAVFLGLATGRPAPSFWEAVAGGDKSWGSLLDEAGLTTDIEGAFARLLAGARSSQTSAP